MKAAFLTSSLIASKGKAAPAASRPAPQHLLEEDAKQNAHQVSRIYQRVRDYAEPENPAEATRTVDKTEPSPRVLHADFRSNPAFGGLDEVTQTAISDEVTRTLAEQVGTAAPAAPAPQSPIDEAEARTIAEEVANLKRDGLGRIRISVRMSPHDHLRLKLIAAHTQMSAQSIFETALEEYITNHGTEILPQGCICVLDKTSM